ncbi:hypothetical protein CEXT_652001 [Caerostris extrusa]|uniref:Uncharacterized protein n=1 Tax=Caerostris extrusa TaxID=172846 RepID=A0AAV4WS37_CAEEX|nr:hypothetical protein CEXT_652001 [Caerostris extrusa]
MNLKINEFRQFAEMNRKIHFSELTGHLIDLDYPLWVQPNQSKSHLHLDLQLMSLSPHLGVECEGHPPLEDSQGEALAKWIWRRQSNETVFVAKEVDEDK